MKRPRHLIKLSTLRLKFVRRFFFLNILKNFLLKALTICFVFKQKAVLVSSKINNFRLFWTRRCILSGRSYAIDSNLKLSRFTLRTMVANGLIGNMRRHSW